MRYLLETRCPAHTEGKPAVDAVVVVDESDREFIDGQIPTLHFGRRLDEIMRCPVGGTECARYWYSIVSAEPACNCTSHEHDGCSNCLHIGLGCK